jgi:hypothetical protein
MEKKGEPSHQKKRRQQKKILKRGFLAETLAKSTTSALEAVQSRASRVSHIQIQLVDKQSTRFEVGNCSPESLDFLGLDLDHISLTIIAEEGRVIGQIATLWSERHFWEIFSSLLT